MAKIINDSLITSKPNAPLDVRTEVATLADVVNISNPSESLVFKVLETGKYYKVDSLKTVNIEGTTLTKKVVESFSPVGDVEEAPKDGSKYYRQDGVWVRIQDEIDISLPILSITLNSDRENDPNISNVKYTVKYASIVKQMERGEKINVPYGAKVTIEFPEIEWYKKPKDIVVDYVRENIIKEVVYEYVKSEIDVYVSSDDGLPVDGQIVTVKESYLPESISNGVYIESTDGILYTIDSWTGEETANSAVVMSDDIKVKIPFYSKALGSGSEFESNKKGTNDLNEALLDMDGEANLSHAPGGAGEYTFPNGDVGAYVPSLGELSLIQKYWADVVIAFAKVGAELKGSTIESSTSTANIGYSGYGLWEMNMLTGEATRSSYFTLIYVKKVSPDEVLKFQVHTEYEVLGGKVSFSATKNNDLIITLNEKKGYFLLPTFFSLVAAAGKNNVSFVYHKNMVTTIRINQTITDPDTMITRIVDEGGIEAVRTNSHRYTGKLNAEGVMELKQLDDNDSTKYVDGTNADITTFGTDVWMKLPQFFWKCEEHETDVWDFSVSYGSRPDDTYKEWDGKDMIGAYKIAATNLNLYSVSGKDVYDAVSLETLITYSKKREDGFSLIKWKHHCMMAMLFYTYYGTTKSDSILGHGSGSTNQATGVTNNLGMNDTFKLESAEWTVQNFWGLENWFTEHSELIGDVRLTQTRWTIEGRNSISPTILSSSSGFHSKMKFGEYIDMFPTELNGTSSTGFVSYSSSPNGDVIVRSISSSGIYSMTNINMNLDLTSKNGVSSRISYYGEYIIKE